VIEEPSTAARLATPHAPSRTVEPTSSPLARTWPAVLLVALAAPFLLWGLGGYSLVNGDERIYHEAALQMVESGDWLRIEKLGEHSLYDTFMNAPLQHWARAVVIKPFGSSEWTVRILTTLVAIACIPMTYLLALHLTRDRGVAFLAGLFHLTTFHFVYLHCARTGELEPVVVLLFTAVAYHFVKGLESKTASFVPHHVCVALLLVLKAPTVLVLALAEGACFALLPAARGVWSRFARTAVLVLPLGLVWHFANLIAYPDASFEALSRMFTQAKGAPRLGFLARRIQNVGYYLQAILFGALPYSLAYPFAVADDLIAGRRRAEGLGFRVLAVFVLAVLVFHLLLVKRQAWYVMPIYPLLSVFLASSLRRLGAARPPVAALAGVALVLSPLAFVRVRVADFNPFEQTAQSVVMRASWVDLGGLPAGAGVLVLAAVLLAGLLVASRRLGGGLRGERLGGALAAAVTLLLLGVAGYRVAAPLRYLDHRSPAAQRRARLDRYVARETAAGRPIAYPIRVPDTWDAPFYLRDRYVWSREDGFLLLSPREPER